MSVVERPPSTLGKEVNEARSTLGLPHGPGGGWQAMIAQATTRLDWAAFCARYFPERGRHDFEVVKAYEAYRNGSLVAERFPREGGAPSGAALQVWEGEGGAVQAGGKEKARRNGPSLSR